VARILVVEDSTFLSKAIRAFLEEEGHQVVGVAGDGFVGSSSFKELKPDLTLLDITMPGMDGRSCLTEILQFDKSARVLMVSAVQSRLAILDCLSAGARGYVEKPLRFDEEDFKTDFRSSIAEALIDD
jgi:two-component system, chemotaxis family, chemotaxis protein CheY